MSLGGGGGGGGNQQLQELAQQLEAIEEQREAVETEIETLRTRKRDINGAIEAIEELETDASVQVPLGGGAHVQATIEDIDEITVDIGGGYAAERDQDGAVDSLEIKQGTLDDRIDDLQSDLSELERESEELEEQAQQLQAQQLQAQQAQRGPDE
jgi:prefoldin, archaeal alpha subunit/eukaryotic subunit 5